MGFIVVRIVRISCFDTFGGFPACREIELGI